MTEVLAAIGGIVVVWFVIQYLQAVAAAREQAAHRKWLRDTEHLTKKGKRSK